jgi:glycine cleavage system H protein
MVQIQERGCKWEFPEELYYRKDDHIWARVESNTVRFGLDDFGQTLAGRILRIKTFPVGKQVRKDHTFGTLESGKYIGPMKAPVSGEVVEVNRDVIETPSMVNDAPYKNWIILVRPTNLDEELEDLVHGRDAIIEWLNKEIEDYTRRELLECK